MTAVWDWVPIADGILAFADFKKPNPSADSRFDYGSGLVYFDEIGLQQLFFEIPSDETGIHYLRDMRYVVALTDDVGYMMILEDRPRIIQVQIGVDRYRELPFFPEEFQSRPNLAHLHGMHGPRQATAIYEVYEQSKMAAELLAWNQKLYLVAKDTMTAEGDTAWWLLQLDPETGEELSRVSVPTTAPHLAVAPGEHWAFVEQGPVQGTGRYHAPFMYTASVVFMPGDRLAAPAEQPLGFASRIGVGAALH